MIPTPDLSHLTRDDFMHVYEPAEDTFLLLDALEEDADHLRALKPSICVEIGSGSGCVSAFLGRILENEPCLIITTDINTRAAKCTEATGRQNKVSLNAVICDLVQPLKPRLYGQIDVLIFNPPYVPTEEEEAAIAQSQGEIAGAWAGGFDGMAVTNRLLDELSSMLSPEGCFYLVALKQNDPQGIIARVREQWSLDGKVS
ncbi:eRF1 methyltransferase catalytic subunit mtq2 OS=Schizosaccharomyces pombe (strain 972 / ATCC 24843) GN=mtq2 PE=3 SV=1 [Rhizoctonia solani AG-1 IB]|uniref:ERF1 methyltransferase catalytic subunit mtq2 n=1 Tax=Thanatephorus cucumeris (strain AG1-IB / isolate 7/3/14) TaxID=1108050 RepID=A0A0B7FL41_THACB|nr:eRF1 methyltransferase catalytic subunit mtq2 OS=Schizosaccharomyces pombe (strain 972 / ATCC 24843) GN=mtq2 PE=3 SV=1 [Rhizoctonia solani AG-1 IB]